VDPPRSKDLYAGVVAGAVLSSILAMPRVPDPPARVWRDWVLVALLVPAAILEGILRDQVVWRPAAIVIVAVLTLTLLWRRTHPLAMLTIGFGIPIGLDAITRIIEGNPVEFITAAFALILPYALCRWASGRDATIGLAVLVLVLIIANVADRSTLSEVIGGTIVVFLPAMIGLEVRHLVDSRERDRESVKARERELLARDLHDSVAHHITAILIQAQAGRIVSATRPAAATDALEVIENAASRTLVEMRSIVAALRVGDDAEFAPQPGHAEIAELTQAHAGGDGPAVHVTLSGDLDDLHPAIDTALYRLAQESITNARRHARRAHRIDVDVCGEEELVRLRITDDGEPRPFDPASVTGFGLLGMSERAALLGGSVHAGPNPHRGWSVTAVLPRTGSSP
jgi:signal transduction histidine kinase